MDRPVRTEQHAKLAAASAETQETREGALWLQLLRALEQHAPDLGARLEDFRAAARGGLKHSLMIAAGELSAALIEGGLLAALENGRDIVLLTRRDVDPIAQTGFLSSYAYALALNSRYEEALECLDSLIRCAESNAIEFAVPYAQLQRAKALVGLRRFAQAGRTLSMLQRQTQNEPNGFFEGNIPIQRARLYASVGAPDRALSVLSLGPPPATAEACRREFLGWQALFSAVAEDREQAMACAAEASATGRGLEATGLALLAESIIALADKKQAESATFMQRVIEAGISDPVLIAVRSSPPLGTFIASQPQWHPWLRRLLTAARDTSLAGSLGLSIPREATAKTVLTPREKEVHELLAQGLTNEEIAKQLYISLSTTKVHVKHIYGKLGVRSRLEAARALRDDV